jgi:hypothetical protein
MELLLGSHVREHGTRVGRMAGFELEPAGLRVRRIIFSPDGELGPQALTRPIVSVRVVRDGEIELDSHVDIEPMPAVPDVVLLSHRTRLRRGDREVGRLTGLDVNAVDRAVLSVFGRQHWWSRRFAFNAGTLDCSTPGEIRARAAGDTRAA